METPLPDRERRTLLITLGGLCALLACLVCWQVATGGMGGGSQRVGNGPLPPPDYGGRNGVIGAHGQAPPPPTHAPAGKSPASAIVMATGVVTAVDASTYTLDTGHSVLTLSHPRDASGKPVPPRVNQRVDAAYFPSDKTPIPTVMLRPAP